MHSPTVLTYDVDPLGISMHWKSAIDVLKFIRDNHKERQDIRDKIRRHAQSSHQFFIIYHPLLHYDITLHSSHDDYCFLHLLNSLIVLEEMYEEEQAQALMTRHEHYASSSHGWATK